MAKAKHSKPAGRHAKEKKDNKFNIKKLVLSMSIVLFVVPIAYYVYNWYSNYRIKDMTNTIAEEASVHEVIENTTNVENTIDEGNPIYDEFLTYLSVDFDTLLKRNSDTKAWIKVDGTNVNYPVVQTNNNEYYLSVAFDDTYNKSRLVVF